MLLTSVQLEKLYCGTVFSDTELENILFIVVTFWVFNIGTLKRCWQEENVPIQDVKEAPRSSGCSCFKDLFAKNR
jgi:hypothetical protein